jgi:hypothetical protein
MRTLRLGLIGADVSAWQQFLAMSKRTKFLSCSDWKSSKGNACFASYDVTF